MSGQPITSVELARLPVSKLRGVGPRKLEGLAKLEIGSLLDLLSHFPRRYIDRTQQRRVAELVPGDEALVLGEVASVSSRRVRGGRSMVVAELRDDSGLLRCTFFNQPWRERQLSQVAAGHDVAVHGKVEVFSGRRQMTNPVVDLVGDRTGRIVAVYPLSDKAGITTWDLSEWVAQTLRRAAPRGIADPVPRWVLDRYDLCDRASALEAIHRPESMGQMVRARQRLVMDELLRLQLALVSRKVELESSSRGMVHSASGAEGAEDPGGLVTMFLASLPFPLTSAQRRTIAEIDRDLISPAPMHRLLQGDVGAGKTVVAVASMLRAVQGGHQAALMAPTEVLAEQHAASVQALLGDLSLPDDRTLLGERPVRLALLTGRARAAERRELLAGLRDGSIDLVVGTHALIQEGVEFASLGVVVVDEQHRFGVEQRAALRLADKLGRSPDVLVMTATPIPRTAAMTVYGDLDISVLDELPPGRTPIETSWVDDVDGLEATWRQVQTEVAEGRRIYVVCPLVEDSDKVEVAAAESTLEQLRDGALAGIELGLLHGRMSSEDKQAAMERFRSGATPVLVATTVIEVGVDVPEATMIVVLDADRFGIAQLHQLRGRVGRGAIASRCVLVTDGEPSEDGRARLEALVRTTDGFELAEVDLDLRGEGTVLGERQKGRNDLKLASLRRDREWVARARDVALELVGDGSGLDAHPELVEELELSLSDEDQEFLLKS